MKFGAGQSIRRKEDDRFLKGAGTYVDDIRHEGQLYAAFFRSPVAHARINGLDTAEAEAAPGVKGVWTGESEDIRAIHHEGGMLVIEQADGTPMLEAVEPALATGTVRYVGQPLAMVVADSAEAAREAADLIAFDFEDLPVLVDPEHAQDTEAPQLFDHVPRNRIFVWEAGDETRTAEAFERADRIVSLRLENPRIIVSAMEPRAINARFEDDRWHIHCATQGVHAMRGVLARELGVAPDRIRLITPDVGGGFGMKLMRHPEYGPVALAARALGAPVKWTATRSESFLGDLQGRDLTTRIEGAFGADGRLMGIRAESVSNLGAYTSQNAAGCHTMFSGDLLPAVYTVPTIFNRVHGVLTNTTPVDAYRGAGRPEAMYMVERLMDRAARELEIDPAELRRRNFPPRDAFPFTTATGVTFDSGDFETVLDAAVEASDATGFDARRRDAASRGRLLGRGLVFYMERTGGGPVENATISVRENGSIEIAIGTQSTGQGHETVWAQIISAMLGVSHDAVTLAQGDSDLLPDGGGTGGSRSLIMGSRTLMVAAEDLIAKARAGASGMLEAAEADIEFDDETGTLRIVGTDRRVTLFEVAGAAGGALNGEGGVDTGSSSFPNGCHICEVEVDPETGDIALTRYTVVDDFGTLLSPMLVRGQIRGGVVQGIGEALMEAARYDPETGQPVTGSYMDYAIPRADDLCQIAVGFEPTPCANNPLGAKGCGESGTVGAVPCILSAALDALAAEGVTDLDMPLSPRRVWTALAAARKEQAA